MNLFLLPVSCLVQSNGARVRSGPSHRRAAAGERREFAWMRTFEPGLRLVTGHLITNEIPKIPLERPARFQSQISLRHWKLAMHMFSIRFSPHTPRDIIFVEALKILTPAEAACRHTETYGLAKSSSKIIQIFLEDPPHHMIFS